MKAKKFESTAIYLFAVSIFASGINYLFQIVSGRLLSTEDYGILNSVFSISNILTIIGVALGLSITKDIATNEKVQGKINYLSKSFALVALPIIAIISVIMRLMHFHISICISTSVAIYLVSATYIYYGMLQGSKNFFHLSIFNLIQPIVKILLGTGLLLIGVGINSAPISMAIGGILCIIYGCIIAKKKFEHSIADFSDIKPILSYTVFTLISTVCITIFNNIDILIVRGYFSKYDVGIYSCASLFGKILMYIPSALTVLLVPVAASSIEEGRIALKKSLCYSFLLSLVAGIGLLILKKPLISILMGEEYLAASEYILPICLAITPLVLATVLINYLIAIGDKIFVSITGLLSLVTMLISIMFIHNTITSVLLVMAFVYLLLTVILFIRSKRVCLKEM